MGAVCTDPAQGPRCADSTDANCPSVYGWRLHTDVAAPAEARDYLENLDQSYDAGHYLSLIDLGDVSWLDYMYRPEETLYEVEPWPYIVARVAVGAEDPVMELPRMMLMCGVHTYEWIPQEVCLGLVDWLVQTANDAPGYEDDHVRVLGILSQAEVWVVVQANPAGRRFSEYDPMGLSAWTRIRIPRTAAAAGGAVRPTERVKTGGA